MRTATSRKWSDEDREFLKKNVSMGTVKLSEHFSVPMSAIRKQANILGLSLKLNKAEIKPIKERKADNSDQFDTSRHKIKNSSTAGLIPLWIASERMTVYHKPGADVERIKAKFENRHNHIK